MKQKQNKTKTELQLKNPGRFFENMHVVLFCSVRKYILYGGGGGGGGGD